MHFATAITDCPDVYDWDVYDDITQQFGNMDSNVQHFLGAVASVSPFLTDLMRKEDAWLRERLDVIEIDQSIEIESTDDIGAALRSAKRRVALWTALCDFSGRPRSTSRSQASHQVMADIRSSNRPRSQTVAARVYPRLRSRIFMGVAPNENSSRNLRSRYRT